MKVGSNNEVAPDIKIPEVIHPEIGTIAAYSKGYIHATQDAFLFVEANGAILYANPAFCSQTGWSVAEIQSLSVDTVLIPHPEAVSLSWKSCFTAGPYTGTLLLKHRNGTWACMEASTTCFQVPEQVICAAVRLVNQDDQQQSKEAQKLQQTLKAYQKVMDHSLDMICSMDKQGRFTHVSKACETVLGYKASELVGRPYTDFIFPEDVTANVESHEESLKERKVLFVENRYIRKDGSLVRLRWSVYKSKDPQTVYAVARELTERDKAAQMLRDIQERYKAIMDLSYDMINIVSEDGEYLFVSESVTRTLGYTQKEMLGKYGFDYMHPDDLHYVKRNFESILQGPKNTTLAFRFRAANGAWRWLETAGSNQLHNPSIRGIVLSSRDITERVHAQQQLEEREQRYRSLFDHSPDAVFAMCTHGRIQSMNQAGIEILQYEEPEISGRSFAELVSADRAQEYACFFESSLRGEALTLETSISNRQQEHVELHLTLIPIRLNGKVMGVYGVAKDITEHKRSSKLIKQNAKRLHTILESITDAFFSLDQHWQFTYINREAERVLKVRRQDCLGKSFWEVFPETTGLQFYDEFNRSVTTNEAVRFVTFYSLLKAWFDVSAYPSREGLSVYFRDVTAAKTQEEELLQLSIIASKIKNAIVVTDKDGKIEWVNDAFSHESGYSLSEVKGQWPAQVLSGPETEMEAHRRISLQAAQGKELVREEILRYNKDGSLSWVQLELTPILNEQGEMQKVIAITTDITDLKNAQQERIRLTEDLLRQNQDLHQFGYIVSHNLRAPVANILGLARLLPRYVGNQQFTDKVLENLIVSAEHLDGIIRDLNHILTLRSDLVEVREEVRLEKEVKAVLNSIKQQIEASGATIITEFVPDSTLLSVRSFVTSIIQNLITNAIKYRSPERESVLHISTEAQGEFLCLRVADNGLGIDLEREKDNIFKLYKRFHFHTEGKGLGLHLVKTQVETLGGKITLESTLDVGTTFRIYFKR